MTWAEFLIRQHAYRRIEESSWYKVREIAYASTIGSHLDPKKIAKTKEKFMPLDSERQNASTYDNTERIRQVQEEFFKQTAKIDKKNG